MKLRPLFFCYDDQALVEAEDAWRVRDAGYGGVWASSVLFKFGGFTGMHFKVSNDNANSVVMALKAKGSTKCVVDDHRVRRARALADTTLRPALPPSLLAGTGARRAASRARARARASTSATC